ncbi:MAG: Uma2 family endonuclease [Proteobacteria bacterium]|nr:Uma2 family endonuclease [Pseudomonadota bacterium]
MQGVRPWRQWTVGNTAEKPMTDEEFFAWAERQEDRYELVDGFPVKMMTGASNFQNLIVVNVIRELSNQLRGKQCRVMTADTAARTRIRSFRRPDATVMCGPARPESYEAHDPKLFVEVLSPSNKGIAWQKKLDEYRKLQRLRYILLVDSERIGAILYTRGPTEWDASDAETLDDLIELPEIGCRLAMRDIYEGVDLPLAD